MIIQVDNSCMGSVNASFEGLVFKEKGGPVWRKKAPVLLIYRRPFRT